jgi:hypothetical protein
MKIFPFSFKRSFLSIPGPKCGYNRTSGFGPDQKCIFDVFEAKRRVVSADDACQSWEGAVIQLHFDSFEGLLGERQIEQM